MVKTKLRETLSFRVTEQLYKELESVANDERRELSDAARALLERGMAQYNRDGKMFEPEAGTGAVEAHPGPTIKVPTVTLGKGKEKKNTA